MMAAAIKTKDCSNVLRSAQDCTMLLDALNTCSDVHWYGDSQVPPFFACVGCHRLRTFSAEDYTYDVAVTACSGTATSSSTVLASLCSESTCNETIGDVTSQRLTTTSVEGDSTTTSFSADFNPLALMFNLSSGESW